ncbi:MAG: EI24 domain-containing protein [Planctomycetes bacterium]|nr:EI24 domain-containing protein [Planctomycetota bacterium]
MNAPRPLPVSTPLPQGFRGAVSGISAFLAGLKMCLPGGALFRFTALAAFVSALVLVALAWVAFAVVGVGLSSWLQEQGWASWLGWLGGVLAFVVALVVAYFLFTPVMTLLGPIFLDPLCERVHVLYTGRELGGPRTSRKFLQRQVSAALQALKWLLLSLLVELPLAVLTMITGVAVVISVPVSALLQGVDLMDTPHSLREYTLSRKLAWAKAHKWPVGGLGAATALCLWVPVLNLFALPAGVAGATILMLAAEQQGD